ncbi:MAG: hypothetical protein K6F94_02845, partial [Bacteroidaceae bacterium]|nr:hypothetical protein [Bacteroidaceae bacterium]
KSKNFKPQIFLCIPKMSKIVLRSVAKVQKSSESERIFKEKNNYSRKNNSSKIFFDAFLLIILRLALGRCLKSKAETWTLFLMNYPCLGLELLVNCSKCSVFEPKKRGFSGAFCTQKATLVFMDFSTPCKSSIYKEI